MFFIRIQLLDLGFENTNNLIITPKIKENWYLNILFLHIYSSLDNII